MRSARYRYLKTHERLLATLVLGVRVRISLQLHGVTSKVLKLVKVLFATMIRNIRHCTKITKCFNLKCATREFRSMLISKLNVKLISVHSVALLLLLLLYAPSQILN